MRILALETSGWGGSVALASQGTTFTGEISADQRSAQALATVIQQTLLAANITPEQLDLIAVTVGPGSFTGLRVGVMTAKTLAYALGCACLGVNTLEVIAGQIAHTTPADSRLWSIMDAQRQQVFSAAYAGNDATRCLRPTTIADNTAWLTDLRPGDIVTGPGLVTLEGKVAAIAGVTIAPREAWFPRAATVGQVALAKFKAGQRDDCWGLAPQYYRLSAAEEKLA